MLCISSTDTAMCLLTAACVWPPAIIECMRLSVIRFGSLHQKLSTILSVPSWAFSVMLPSLDRQTLTFFLPFSSVQCHACAAI